MMIFLKVVKTLIHLYYEEEISAVDNKHAHLPLSIQIHVVQELFFSHT